MKPEWVGTVVAFVVAISGGFWALTEVAEKMGRMQADIASNITSLELLTQAYVQMTACPEASAVVDARLDMLDTETAGLREEIDAIFDRLDQ